MPTIRLTPSTYYIDSSNLSVRSASNMYNNTDNTTYATVTNSSASTTSYYIYVRGFNFDDIPNAAVVNSFTIKLKARQSGVSTSDSYKPYLANGTSSINGSCSAITTTATVFTFSGISANWETIKNYGSSFGIRINCRRASKNTTGYMYIYGAEIEVNYTVPVYHQITSTNNSDSVDLIDPEGVTQVPEGDDYTLEIYANDISNIVVEDNNTDVTSLLVQHTVPTGGSDSTVLGQYSLVSGSFNGSGATYFQGIVGNGVNASQTTSNYYSSGSGNITVFTYKLLFNNIPANATITRLYCEVNGHAESTSNSNEYMCVQLRSNNTELSSELNFKSIGTSNSTQTIEATTLPTLAQLDNLVLYCRLGYYGGAINGATCYIEYTTPSSSSQYYWTYSLTNVTAAHTIQINDAVIIPPEEDPAKTYYPITISSINATTTPGKGTTRVESGTSDIITITPSDPQLTLALDNGVDITSQLVSHGGTISNPTVATASGASYGFNLNSSTGYYVSTNSGVSSSAAVCRVTFNLPVRCLVTFQYINYAEATYDFGVFGKIDTTLSTNAWNSSSNSGDTTTDAGLEQIRLNTSSSNTSTPQTLTYEIPSGQHYIDIKYGKDQASDSNNDSLQWKITSIEPLEPNNYYTYTLSNINQDHSLIFIFGNVTYYFVSSSTSSDCTLYPNGQMVQLPGDSYRLIIVPKNGDDTITMTDNNVNVTSQLERKNITTEKDGQTITVVNYIYKLTNIQATHTINVYSSAAGLATSIKLDGDWTESTLSMKDDNKWNTIQYTKIYVHNGTTWVENAQRTINTKGILFSED